MIQNPITITDYSNPQECFQKKMENDKRAKLQQFQTRLFSGNLRSRSESNISLGRENSQNGSLLKQEEKKKKVATFVQPRMRFKPKSDIERVLETINSYSYGRIDETIMKNVQSNGKKIIVKKDKNKKKQNKTEKNVDENKSDSNWGEKYVENSPKINLKKNIIKRYDKSAAKIFLKELHNKTHFKAATDFTNFNKIGVFSPSSTNHLNKVANTPSFGFLPNGSNLKASSDKEFSSSTNYQKFGILDKQTLKEINLESLKKNPLLFSSRAEPSPKETVNPFILERLRRMTLSNSLSNESDKKMSKKVNFLKFLKKPRDKQVEASTRRSVLFGLIKEFDIDEMTQNKKDEEKVMIGNEEFLKTETDKIAKVMLKNCNYFHTKNKNNDTFIPKAGEGKLMITNGLTVKQFQEKFLSAPSKKTYY